MNADATQMNADRGYCVATARDKYHLRSSADIRVHRRFSFLCGI